MAVGTTTRKRGGTKWFLLAGLGLAGFISVEAGYAGYGWAQLKASVFPRDEALLSYVPGTTRSVVIFDPHQLDLKALGDGAVRSYLDRTRKDVKEATGIDLGFDVDKMVLSPTLAVAKGRFDAKKLEERLAKHRYAAADYKGVRYLARAGEDAIAVLDGSILLYADEPGIKAAIDAHQGDDSLEKNEQAVASLRRVGWEHPLLVTVQVTDQKPSLRQILAGSGGPRAVTTGITTKMGLDVDTAVESASGTSADELRKLLEEKRGNADAISGFVGPEVAAVLTDVAKKATIVADPKDGSVRIRFHMDPPQVETLVKSAAHSVPLAETYKVMRLYQLLVPTP